MSSVRFPHNLSVQVPWQQQQAGVYHCRWGLDVVRVVVAGELPREPQNAPLHLFSASPELVGFGSSHYRQRSENTSLLLGQLFDRFQGEGLVMTFTMEDFKRQVIGEQLAKLTPKERRAILEALPPEERLAGIPPEERLAGMPAEQIRRYLEQLTAGRPARPRKPRRKR
jgi:hypothetical protein